MENISSRHPIRFPGESSLFLAGFLRHSPLLIFVPNFSSLMVSLKTDLVEHRDRHTNRYDTMGVPGCRAGRVSIMGGPRYGEA